MAVVYTDVGEIVEAVRSGVERRIGRRRKIRTAEDLIEDVGLNPDQFEDLLGELEQRFGVEFDPDTADQLTLPGALIVRLLRLSSRVEEDQEAA